MAILGFILVLFAAGAILLLITFKTLSAFCDFMFNHPFKFFFLFICVIFLGMMFMAGNR
ncbi:MAG: hypothetical protein WCQ99_11650 [Pseudomonadota bacterium]